MDSSIINRVEMLHLTFLKANQGNMVTTTGWKKSIQVWVVQVILSIPCSRSGKMHQLFSKVLPSVWFYIFTTSLGGRSGSLFFHPVFPPFFGVGGRVDKIGIVFLADRALESKVILTDLNDVPKSTGWSPTYRTSNKRSGRYTTVPIPVTFLKSVAEYEYDLTVRNTEYQLSMNWH